MAHVTPYRLALGWLSVARRREYFIGSLALKISRLGTPSFLADRFIPLHSRPDIRRSRRTEGGYFLVPQARTEALRRSFTFRAIETVNGLRACDPRTVPLDVFQSKLFENLLARDHLEWVQRAHRDQLEALPPQLVGKLTLPPLPRARL